MKLTIEQLTVTYRDGDHALQALDRVGLSLEPDRITALVGESGSGKTLAALAVLGLLPPVARITGGRIDFNGMDLVSLRCYGLY